MVPYRFRSKAKARHTLAFAPPRVHRNLSLRSHSKPP